jgi:hypothetical protein
MIGKITKGSDFAGVFAYILNPDKQPTILNEAKHCIGTNALDLTHEFQRIADLRPRTQKMVRHFSIGFAPEDGEVDNDVKAAIAMRVMNEMGFENCQYLAVAHHRDDPGHQEIHNHDHLHIVANAVTLDGQRVPDFCDFRNLEQSLRKIERDFQLRQINCSWERQSLPQPDLQSNLQKQILAAIDGRPTLEVAIERLAAAQIDVRFRITNRGKVQGVSFIEDGKKIKGSEINCQWKYIRAHTEPDPSDRTAIEATNIRSQSRTIELTQPELERFSYAIELAQARLGQSLKFKSRSIEIRNNEGTLSIQRLRPHKPILSAIKDSSGVWMPSGFVDIDKQDMKLLVGVTLGEGVDTESVLQNRESKSNIPDRELSSIEGTEKTNKVKVKYPKEYSR